MTNVNNITNQIKPQGADNASGVSGVIQPNKGSQQVNGLGDFIALLIQNVQPTSETKDDSNLKLQTQIQELLQKSPEELTALLQKAQTEQTGEETNSLLSLLNAIGITADEIGLDTKQLPPSLIGQATAIQAQLLTQSTVTQGTVTQDTVTQDTVTQDTVTQANTAPVTKDNITLPNSNGIKQNTENNAQNSNIAPQNIDKETPSSNVIGQNAENSVQPNDSIVQNTANPIEQNTNDGTQISNVTPQNTVDKTQLPNLIIQNSIVQNKVLQDTSAAPHTHTKTSFTPAAGVSASPVLSDTPDTPHTPSHTGIVSQNQPKNTVGTSLSGPMAGEAPILSFNAVDALKSFLPDEAGRKPSHAKNIAARPIQNLSEPSQQQPSLTTQHGQQKSITLTQPSSTPLAGSISTPDPELPASSTSPFIASLISSKTDTDSTIILHTTTSNADLTTDIQTQGRPITAQNFAAHITAKTGVFQSQSSQQIYMSMQRNAAAKIEQMTLQLEPADLGRIEINIKFGKDGSMKAHLIVEKQDTMGLLQRDANALENALKDAGIELDDSALSFDLASGDDQFDKTQEQNEHDHQFSLDMMMDQEIKIADAALAEQTAANQNASISKNSVNILI